MHTFSALYHSDLSSAVKGGASRLEVCGNLGVGGGTTPSLGLLKAIEASVDVPIMAMIRPRTGDFLYSDEEIEVMLEDIRIFKSHGICGVVLGALKADGRVDVDVSKRYVQRYVACSLDPIQSKVSWTRHCLFKASTMHLPGLLKPVN